jgi:hypothetical protein
MTQRKRFASVAALLGVALLAPALQAQTCSGNGEVLGSYGYFASRDGYFLLGATPPGTALVPIGVTPPGTTALAPPLVPIGVTPPGTATGSNTPWGRLVAGLANNGVMSVLGRIFADGMGNLYASPTFGGLNTTTLAGTYNVTTDCSITMAIRDPFLTGTDTGPTVNLTGVVRGNRIEAIMTGPSAAGATVTFVRTSQFNNCTVASLTGPFSITGTGMTLPGFVNPGTSTGVNLTGGPFTPGQPGNLGTAFNLFGRFTADGSGILLPATGAPQATVNRTLTGTYTLNPDCTGTMRIADAAGNTRNLSFVLVNESSGNVPPVPIPTPSPQQQALRFVFSDPGVIGQGTADPF